MGEEQVNAPWADEVTLKERNGPDFETRTHSISIYDVAQQYRRLATEFGNHWGIPRNAAADRAIRIYTAHILDDNQIPDLREATEQTVLIPPQGWVAENQSEWKVPAFIPDPDPVEEKIDRTIRPTIPPTVGEMVSVLVEEFEVADTKSGFAKAAHRFIAEVDEKVLEGDQMSMSWPRESASSDTATDDLEGRPFMMGELFNPESRLDLIEYFLSDSVNPEGENQSRIAEKSGVSRNSVGRHINTLVEFGVVDEKGDGAIRKYAPRTDSRAYKLIVSLNRALNAEKETEDV